MYQQYPANANPAIPATLQPITITGEVNLKKIYILIKHLSLQSSDLNNPSQQGNTFLQKIGHKQRNSREGYVKGKQNRLKCFHGNV